MPLIQEIETPQKDEKVIVFAPHCDDEVLGAGGLIARSIKNGASVKLVLMTNGDGHRYSTVEDFRKIYPTPEDYINSGYNRQKESLNALEKLGVNKEDVIFLGFPDHGLGDMYGKNWSNPYKSSYTKKDSVPYANAFIKNVPYTGEKLSDVVTNLLEKVNPDFIIYPSSFDGHDDHAATNKFVEKSIKQLDYSKKYRYTYLVHYSNWPLPRGLKRTRFITPPAKLIQIQETWTKLTLTDDEEALKESALAQYSSQLQTPALKILMQGFIRRNELFTLIGN